MKIAIAGYGAEGRDNYSYFRDKYPDEDITIVDSRELSNIPRGAKTLFAVDAFKQLTGYDLVVRTAGLPPSEITTDGRITSSTNEFFDVCPCPIVVVTGTHGKGTTSSLITSLLKAYGLKVHLVGNIGIPALGELKNITPDDIVVYEMSSFQAWDFYGSPKVAVITPIESDHINKHGSLSAYLDAKSNVVRHQSDGDIAFYYGDNKLSYEVASKGPKALPYPSPSGAHIVGDKFFVGQEEICDIDNLALLGKHNINNALGAISVARFLRPDITGEQIARGLNSFHGLPHRLQFIAEKQGVKFYDDNLATTPGSSSAALATLAGPKVLILGGGYKGGDFTSLVKDVLSCDVHDVIVYGEEADRINKYLVDAGAKESVITNLGQTPTMDQIVEASYKKAHNGDIVVMSPGCNSGNLFKSSNNRGEQFTDSVLKLLD